MNRPQQQMQQPTLMSEVEVTFTDGYVLIVEHCLHMLQLSPSGNVMVLEQPRGDRLVHYLNMNEVKCVRCTPSKVELS